MKNDSFYTSMRKWKQCKEVQIFSNIPAAEIKYLRNANEYTRLDKRSKEDIRKKLNVIL